MRLERVNNETQYCTYPFSVCIYKEPLIKLFHTPLSYGFSRGGNNGFAFNQRFLNQRLVSFAVYGASSAQNEQMSATLSAIFTAGVPVCIITAYTVFLENRNTAFLCTTIERTFLCSEKNTLFFMKVFLSKRVIKIFQ